MSRQERRAAERAGARPKAPATQADAKRFIDQAFTDRISWVAARVLLERALPIVRSEDDGVADAIERFLEAHPRPAGVDVGPT